MNIDQNKSIERSRGLKFPVLFARGENGPNKKSSSAGNAFYVEDGNYYVLKLALFPFSYFLRRNKGSDGTYTVFAKRKWANNTLELHNPIGRASLDQTWKSYLQIEIPILGLKLFMSLFPAKTMN